MVDLKSVCDIKNMQKGTYKYVSGNSCGKKLPTNFDRVGVGSFYFVYSFSFDSFSQKLNHKANWCCVNA